MEQQPNDSPSPGSQSFAGLLASFTSPGRASAVSDPGWDGEEFRDDVVTLSYEQALRRHAVHRAKPQNESASEPEETAPPSSSLQQPSGRVRAGEPAVASADASPRTVVLREPRTASVTIRLSQAECTRLHQRATEAGLTVSAYLRSCVLEADALRAQVKEALAEMKTAAEVESTGTTMRKPWFGWIGRIAEQRV